MKWRLLAVGLAFGSLPLWVASPASAEYPALTVQSQWETSTTACPANATAVAGNSYNAGAMCRTNGTTPTVKAVAVPTGRSHVVLVLDGATAARSAVLNLATGSTCPGITNATLGQVVVPATAVASGNLRVHVPGVIDTTTACTLNLGVAATGTNAALLIGVDAVEVETHTPWGGGASTAPAVQDVRVVNTTAQRVPVDPPTTAPTTATQNVKVVNTATERVPVDAGTITVGSVNLDAGQFGALVLGLALPLTLGSARLVAMLRRG